MLFIYILGVKTLISQLWPVEGDRFRTHLNPVVNINAIKHLYKNKLYFEN